MRIGKLSFKPIKIAALTSILSAVFTILDALSIYQSGYPELFSAATLVLIIIYIYSQNQDLYAAPEISILIFFLLILLGSLESLIGSSGLALEEGLLIIFCLVVFYQVVWRRGLLRFHLTAVLLGLVITGIYILQEGYSFLLPGGVVLGLMPLILYSLKLAQESFSRLRTPVGFMHIGLGILTGFIYIDVCFVVIFAHPANGSGEDLSSATFLVMRVLLAGMIVLGSLARYRQFDDKPTEVFRLLWWGGTFAAACLVLFSHPFLTRLSALYGLDGRFNWLSVILWAVFACTLSLQIILWAYQQTRWQWNAFTLGSVGGLLLSYFWAPFAHAISYLLFVPGQTLTAIDLDDGLQLVSGASILILFAMLFLAIQASRPKSRLHSIAAGVIAGTTMALYLFISSGANLSVIASQQPIFGAAFTRVGYEEIGWTSAIAEAVLYIHPWVYGALAVCLVIGLVPAMLIGITWPTKRNPVIISEKDEPISPSVPVHLISLSLAAIILIAVFRLLDYRIANTLAGVGLNPWFKPGWIIPLVIAIPAFILMVITIRIFIRMQVWKRSPRTSILVCLSGLILMLDALGIWFISPEYGVAMFISLGVGIEVFRQGMRLWENPEPNPSSGLMPVLSNFDAVSGLVPALLTTSISLLPSLVIATGLGAITIAAIPDLREINAAPPGAAWLTQMLDQATSLVPSISVFGILFFFWILWGIYGMTDLAGNPTRIRYWWEKIVPMRQKLAENIRQGFQHKGRARLLVISWSIVGVAIALSLWNDISKLIVLLFLVSYISLKLRPDWFRKFSWPSYNISGLILLASIFSGQDPLLKPVAVLAGPALALIYRGLVVYSSDSRRTIFRSLFFPALGIFISLNTAYLDPLSVVQYGIAKYKDGLWDNIGARNSPIAGGKNYSLFVDSKNGLWISGYYGPEALLQNDSWERIRISPPLSPSTDTLSLSGRMMEKDGMYYFVNDYSLVGIFQENDTYVSNRPSRLRPAPLEDVGDQSTNYGEHAGPCGTLAIDESYECPSIPSKITSAAIDPDGFVWVGTSSSGVARFHYDNSSNVWNWTFFTTSNSNLSSDYINEISAGEDGVIWTLSPSGVNSRSPDGSWTIYPLDDLGFGSNPPQAFLLDREGRLWVGSTAGISIWQDGSWKKTSLSKPSSISGFYEDRTGTIWALSASGAWKHSEDGWTQIVNITTDPFRRNPFGISSFYRVQPTGSGIKKAVEDQEGNLWFSGPHGLLRYDPESAKAEKFYPSNSGLPSENVQDILMDINGTIWVSTYTPIIAYRTELPILGFSILAIGALLGIIYIGYQNAPQFRAVQIAKRLAVQRRNLLPEIYQIQADPDFDQVLEALASQQLPEKRYSSLAAAYAGVVSSKPMTIEEQALRILHVLQENTDLVSQVETAGLYEIITRVIQVRSIPNIAEIHLTVLRSETTGRVTLAHGDKPPFELPAFISPGVPGSLEMLGRASLLLRRYLQVDNPQDRLGFIADSLGALEKAAKDAASITGAEYYCFRKICDLWLEIIRRELDLLSGHADLRVEFRTKQVMKSDNATLVLKVWNAGSSIANQVQIRLLPNDQTQPGAVALREFEYLGAGDSETVEFSTKAPETDNVRIEGEITWSDRIGNDNRIEFADMIRFYDSTGRFQRIANPYVVGHPVKSTDLFRGREDIFEFISHNIHGTTQSRTLVLFGQRRTGKTSILYQLLGGRLGREYIPVLVDIQELAPGIQNMADLFLELALHVERSLKKSGIKPEKIDEQSFSRSPTRSFSHYLEDIQELLAGRKIVIMFDEFELLEDRILQGKLEPEALGYLRSLMQHKEELIFIFTGTHKLEQMSVDYWSIFFNIALHQQVSFMEEQDAIRLIREPIQGMLSIDDLVVEKILSLTQGHPYFIQLLCWALVNYCNRKERNYATLSDLNDVLKDIFSNGEPYFAYVWTQVGMDEKILLSALSERLTPGRRAVSINELMETIENSGAQFMEKTAALKVLDRLTSLEILSGSGPGGIQYSYRVGLIGEWVKNSKPLRHLVERES